MNKINLFLSCLMVAVCGFGISAKAADIVTLQNQHVLESSVSPVNLKDLSPVSTHPVSYDDDYGVIAYEPSLSFVKNDPALEDIILVGAVLNGRVSTLKVNQDDTVDVVLKDLNDRRIIYKNIYQGSVVFKDGSPVLRGEVLGKAHADNFALSIIDKDNMPFITRLESDNIALAKLSDIKIVKDAKRDASYAFITQYNQNIICRLVEESPAMRAAANNTYRAYYTSARPRDRKNFFNWCKTNDGFVDTLSALQSADMMDDLMDTYCGAYPSDNNCQMMKNAGNGGEGFTPDVYTPNPPGVDTGGFQTSSYDGSSGTTPFAGVNGNEASSGTGELASSPYCNAENAQTLTDIRERELEKKEGIRSATMSPVMNVLENSCMEIYESKVYTQIADTFTNTGGGIFGAVFSSLASYASEELANAACDKVNGWKDSLISSAQGQANAMFSKAISGDQVWSKIAQKAAGNFRPSDYMSVDRINSYIQQNQAPLDQPFE